MRTAKFSAISILCVYIVLISGCADELSSLRVQNSTTDKTWVFADPVLAYWDDKDAGDSDWDSPSNWNPDVLPTSNDSITIDIPQSHCYVNSGVTANCNDISLGQWKADTNDCYLDVNGGTVLVGGDAKIGVFQVTGAGGGVGQLVLSSGNFNVAGDMHVGFDGKGTLQMTGGAVNIDGMLYTPGGGPLLGGSSYAGQCYINLEGGTINAGGLNRSSDWTNPGICDINITGGTLIIDGDESHTVSWYVESQWMKYATDKSIKWDYDVTNAGKTTVTAAVGSYWTDGDGGNSNWDDADNWDGGVPNSADFTAIRITDKAVIAAGMSAACDDLIIADVNEGTCELEMTGGSLAVTDDLTIGRFGLSVGLLDLDDGDVNVGGDMYISNSAGGDMYISKGGSATIDMDGGTLDVTGTLHAPAGWYGFSTIDLTAGTFTVGGLDWNPKGTIDVNIGGGTWIITGDVTSTINTFISK